MVNTSVWVIAVTCSVLRYQDCLSKPESILLLIEEFRTNLEHIQLDKPLAAIQMERLRPRYLKPTECNWSRALGEIREGQLATEVRPYDWTRKWSKIMKRRGGLAWRPGRSRLLWGVDPFVGEIAGMSSQVGRAYVFTYHPNDQYGALEYTVSLQYHQVGEAEARVNHGMRTIGITAAVAGGTWALGFPAAAATFGGIVSEPVIDFVASELLDYGLSDFGTSAGDMRFYLVTDIGGLLGPYRGGTMSTTLMWGRENWR